jgi:uncharacterized protein YndB with AHSA1/START domain
MTAATTLEIEIPTDRPVILWSRFVKCSPQLAWEMWTQPEHLRNWMGPRDLETVLCEGDVRPGGAWRFVHRAPDGSEYGFRGEYRVVEPPRLLVNTWMWEGMPDDVSVETIHFDAVEGGTRLHGVSEHTTIEARDQHVANGMERGMAESYERFDERVAQLQDQGAA